MRYTVRIKAFSLLGLLLVHTAFASPIVKRDVERLLGADSQSTGVADPRQVSLLDADVFGGDVQAGGAREKRLLKLKALGLGAGLKAVGAGVKTVGALGVKAVGKTALKAVTKVGAKVAKAAITLTIAKLLLNLVFGKINQLIDFKTRLLGNVGSGKGILGSSNLSSLSGGSGGGGGATATASADASISTDDTGTTDETAEELPDIDPQKVSLDVPGNLISGGFNVVNRASPVIGEVLQRTAERLVNLGSSLKPLFASSLGVQPTKREAPSGDVSESSSSEISEASSTLSEVKTEPESQFKRKSEEIEVPKRPADYIDITTGLPEQ